MLSRYENINKPCRQRDHKSINLLDHNNVWYCTKCNNILIYNRKSLVPANYEYYVKFVTERNIKPYTKEQIDKWLTKVNVLSEEQMKKWINNLKFKSY